MNVTYSITIESTDNDLFRGTLTEEAKGDSAFTDTLERDSLELLLEDASKVIVNRERTKIDAK